MNDRINKICKEVEDIKDSLQFTQNNMEQNIKSMKEKVQKIELNNRDIYIEELKRKMVDTEDQSRRQNLRADGMMKDEREDRDQ